MDRDAWLKQTVESALEPELEICDPHHHLWAHPGNRYQNAELLADLSGGHRVTSTVFVECRYAFLAEGPAELRCVGETERVERHASDAERDACGVAVAAGIVGFADLTLGARVRDALDAHIAASPRFRGIRHASAWDGSEDIRNAHSSPPEGLLGRADFREGFAVLEELGLSFDAWLYHPQLGELTQLAHAFPGVVIVLDHIGAPLGIGRFAGQRAAVFSAWRAAIEQLAKCPNVFVKLGGLGMPIYGNDWHKRDVPLTSVELAELSAPYYQCVIDAFGPIRCMFESNFPVDKVSYSYTVLWNSFKRLSAGFSSDEREALFWGTAREVYRL